MRYSKKPEKTPANKSNAKAKSLLKSKGYAKRAQKS
jgi:hypothetical protein